MRAEVWRRTLKASSQAAVCLRALDAARPLYQVNLVRGRWLALLAAQLRGSRAISIDTRAALGKSFARIDAKTAAVKAASGFQCPSGCGKCCTSRFVEATEVECIPLALALIEQGKASAVLERIKLAKSAGEATCVIYEPTNPDGSKGQCGMYDHRPGLCRLFGFFLRKTLHCLLCVASEIVLGSDFSFVAQFFFNPVMCFVVAMPSSGFSGNRFVCGCGWGLFIFSGGKDFGLNPNTQVACRLPSLCSDENSFLLAAPCLTQTCFDLSSHQFFSLALGDIHVVGKKTGKMFSRLSKTSRARGARIGLETKRLKS